MSNNLITLASLRISEANPNHHLWNNNGTWFLHYTVYPTPFTKERIRRSLGTKDVKLARERRDNFFALLAKQSAAPATPALNGQVAVARVSSHSKQRRPAARRAFLLESDSKVGPSLATGRDQCSSGRQTAGASRLTTAATLNPYLP